jgi:hypothetical protein
VFGGEHDGVDGQEPSAPVNGVETQMIPVIPREAVQANASFHDARVKETYASWFRPIALPAVAAGTRSASAALEKQRKELRADLPGVLRHGFDD